MILSNLDGFCKPNLVQPRVIIIPCFDLRTTGRYGLRLFAYQETTNAGRTSQGPTICGRLLVRMGGGEGGDRHDRHAGRMESSKDARYSSGPAHPTPAHALRLAGRDKRGGVQAKVAFPLPRVTATAAIGQEDCGGKGERIGNRGEKFGIRPLKFDDPSPGL